jgi:Uri superfamily endonuclease
LADDGRPVSNSGVYVLWLYLPEARTIAVGRLGVFPFLAGIYSYSGSAQRNLQQRLDRHGRLDKKHRWHIDYLRQECCYLGHAVLYDQAKETECALTKQLLRIPTARYVVPGFGSSDCSCVSHLIHIPLAQPRST